MAPEKGWDDARHEHARDELLMTIYDDGGCDDSRYGSSVGYSPRKERGVLAPPERAYRPTNKAERNLIRGS